MMSIADRDVHRRVNALAFEIVERELNPEHFKQHLQALEGMRKTAIPDELTRKIVQMIQAAVDADPEIQKGKERRYIHEIGMALTPQLFLRLQKKLGIHPFQ